MANSTSLESEITEWIVKLIEDEKLLDAIDEQEGIDAAIESNKKRTGVPAYGFDHLSRRANVRAASVVLKSLGLLDVIAVNKSISLTTGEVLRPDILCFNPESRTLVVFEVKRDKLTERQAVTELAGYEQELRNALPFLGDFDVNFVLISTHWDILLSHAVANFNTWSGKNCLALKVSADQRPFTLACHLPDAWQLRGSSALPHEALQSIDLYLYEADGNDEDEDQSIPAELITAINIIARSGDRHESHGFAMLWWDHAQFGNGHWCLTLCGVDPLAMYAWCSKHGLAIRVSQLTEYLDKHVADVMSQAPASLYKIAKESFPVLRGKYCPTFETDCTWSEKIELLRRRASPVYFEFWGSLGDYAREFICYPDVRGRYMAYIDRHGFDWTHPNVAFPLLGNICGDIPFPDGIVRCSEAFNAGVKLGLHELLANIADKSEAEAHKLSPLLQWSMLEATRVAIEMAEIYRTVKEVDVPPPPLSTAPDKCASSTTELCEWATKHLIGGDHPVHQCCFELGRRGAAFFSDWLDESERRVFLNSHADVLAGPLREMLVPFLVECHPFAIEPERTHALRAFLRRIGIDSADALAAQSLQIHSISASDLLFAFRDHGASGLDEVIPAVLHTVGELPDMALDWGGMKESIQKIFESGCRWPAVMLTQNGRHGVGMVDEQIRSFLVPIQDPSLEVYFLDQKSVSSYWVKMTWSELQNRLSPQV